MKKKVKIVTHGSTWIDTSTPTVCPECASLNVKEYTYNNSEWHGPFLVGYSKKIYTCEDCDCRFKISKDEKSINDCCWDELWFDICVCTFVLLLILIVISVIFWNEDTWPSSMKIAIIIDVIIALISFIAWAVSA